MKDWPENNQPANFEDIIAPLKKTLRFAYKMRRQNQNKDIPYDGFDIGARQRVTCFHADEILSVELLKFSKEDQGRDALDEILGIAVRLGIEQGRRL